MKLQDWPQLGWGDDGSNCSDETALMRGGTLNWYQNPQQRPLPTDGAHFLCYVTDHWRLKWGHETAPGHQGDVGYQL